MHITIIAVGKIREKFFAMAIDEYLKRLQRYATLSIIEVAEEQAPETLSPAEQTIVKMREGERILRQLRDGQYVIALAIDGEQLSSEAYAASLNQLGINGQSDIVLIIGGSLGLADDVSHRANTRLSFGKMTFPHQLMRIILLEQTYRAFRIIRGEPYHK